MPISDIIEPKDFTVRPVRIGNLSESPDFLSFLNHESENLLVQCLGKRTYDLIIEELANSQVDEVYHNMVEGALYNTSIYFPGLRESVRCYIYGLWLQVTQFKQTNVGIVSSKPALPNNEVINNLPFVVTNINRGYELLGGQCNAEIDGTLYGYMKHFPDDFPYLSDFKPKEFINRYLL